MNEGTSDAIIKEIGTLVDESEPSSLIFSDFEKVDGKDYRLVSGEEGSHLTKEKFLRILTRQDPQLFCAGYIEYADAAGKRRKTGFCWWTPDGVSTWKRCDEFLRRRIFLVAGKQGTYLMRIGATQRGGGGATAFWAGWRCTLPFAALPVSPIICFDAGEGTGV